MATLASLASQIRSKNAGPLQLTIDIFFDDEKNYERVRDSGLFDAATVAQRYRIPEDNVLGIYTLDHIQAIKVSLKRPTPSGNLNDTDIYGAQQHGPLVDLEI